MSTKLWTDFAICSLARMILSMKLNFHLLEIIGACDASLFIDPAKPLTKPTLIKQTRFILLVSMVQGRKSGIREKEVAAKIPFSWLPISEIQN